jgi:hypothetical protein
MYHGLAQGPPLLTMLACMDEHASMSEHASINFTERIKSNREERGELLSHQRKVEQSPALFPSAQGQRPLYSTSPASKTKVFHRTLQDCTLSLIHLF